MKTVSRWQLMAETPRALRDSLGYLHNAVNKYGDIVRFNAGDTIAFLVAKPDVIGHVLVENWRNYSKATPQFETFKAVTGNGLLNSDGDFWLSQRRLQQPSFHRGVLEGFADLMVSEAQQLAQTWAQQDGAEIDIEAAMMELSLRVICAALFGMDMAAHSAEYVQQFAAALDYVMYLAQWPVSGAADLPLPVVKRYEHAIASLDSMIAGLIAHRHSQPAVGSDLLGMLLAARDEQGNGLPAHVIRDEVMTLIVAGYETVATGLTWLWYMLDQNRAVRDRLRADLHAQVGERPMQLADLSALPFLQQVVDEAFRLIPPSWLISRRAKGPDTFDGIPIPAESLVIISPFVMHRNARYWTEPERFDPSRFSAENRTSHQRHQYIPFGAGPRLCIGNRFAEMETQLVIGTLLPLFDAIYEQPQPPKLIGRITVRPKDKMPLRIRRIRR